MKISIIIPVYNEFHTFKRVLERVRQAHLPSGCSKEIIVVDDGSTDGTTQMIGEEVRAGIVVGHYSRRNSGKGAAIRIGIEISSGDIILIQDGDLEYDPNDYHKLLAPIVKTNTDAIKEIVRQIRLRDLGGIIVVDFIDMDERKNRQKVIEALEDAMRDDREPYKILQFNDF